MRNTMLVGIIIGVFILFSGCAESTAGGGGDSFKDQNLQGQVMGSSYEFVSGYAYNYAYGSDDEWWIYLYNITPAAGLDPYDSGAYDSEDYLQVFLTALSADVGEVYQVTTNSSSDGIVLTFSDSTSLTEIDVAISGYIEITEIDETAGTVSGKVNISGTGVYGTSSVNGNFTVPIDPQT